MKCFEIDLSKMLKVTMLGKSELKPPSQHITRYISEHILYIITSGGLCLEQNGERLELFPGDVYIFGMGEFQKPLKNTECEFYFLHFETDAFAELEMTDEEYCACVKQRKADFMKADIYGSKSYDHMKVLLKQRMHIADKARLEHVVSIFRNNAISYGYNAPKWRLNISNAAAGILIKLEDICFESLDKGYQGKNGRVYDTVKRISDYIEEHFRENFGSHDIERDLLINFDYANRIFKKNIGYSIIRYRNILRINTAKTLVCDANLDEVAAKVGFNNRYYFSRCFKKIEGVSPEEYRERAKRAQEK